MSLAFFYVLPDMFTYKLECRIARGMVKNRLCQGSPMSPLGYGVGSLPCNAVILLQVSHIFHTARPKKKKYIFLTQSSYIIILKK